MRVDSLIRAISVVVILAAGALWGQGFDAEALATPVTAQDSGSRKVHNGWFPGHKDHTWREQLVTLSSDVVRYKIKYRACVDDSHSGVCVRDEGFIGMPGPNVANWYHTGFYHIEVNGKELGSHPLTDMRVTESGGRGAFHMVWDTPDCVARLQFLLEPGADHLLSLLSWEPKTGRTVGAVKVRLTCYPSFFTAARNRQGDRTLVTPRTSVHERATSELAPAEDTYLLYSDGVFDVAKGEGSGPCAMLFLPEQIAVGRVEVTGYPIQTMLEPAEGLRQLRLAFWDLTGKTNAEAQAYMDACASRVQHELRTAVFCPESVARYVPADAAAEIAVLLSDARDDGIRLRAKTEGFLKTLNDLKVRADRGDWEAETEFAECFLKYDELVWKLRIFALLNRP